MSKSLKIKIIAALTTIAAIVGMAIKFITQAPEVEKVVPVASEPTVVAEPVKAESAPAVAEPKVEETVVPEATETK